MRQQLPSPVRRARRASGAGEQEGRHGRPGPPESGVEWWARRGRSENPTIFEGAATARDAVEALALNGYDWVFVDGPPAFLSLIQEIIEVATFVLIPVKPSMVDLLATQDAVSLARDAHATHLAVVNDVGPRERAAEAELHCLP